MLTHNLDVLAELDFLFAKARIFPAKCAAVQPKMNDQGIYRIKLVRGGIR
ncbi:MAG: hypothetical protein V8Q82_02895 [Christensenellales bacterium]